MVYFIQNIFTQINFNKNGLNMHGGVLYVYRKRKRA